MNLTTIPFNDIENNISYKYKEFKERGYPMATLTIDMDNAVMSRNSYRFGLIDNQNIYHWFFKKTIVCDNRMDALKIYNALLTVCNQKKLGRPFVFKNQLQ